MFAKKNKFFIVFFVVLSLYITTSLDQVKASEVQDLVDFTNMSSNITSESTIIPYKQVFENSTGELDIASTIYSRDSWVNEVIELALTKEGCKYSQAKREKENIYDCSSFVRRMYEEITGVYIGSTTVDINRNLKNFKVDYSEREPGDILWKEGHVALYIGNDKIIHAKGTEYGVIIEDVSKGDFTKCFRPIDYIRYIIQ